MKLSNLLVVTILTAFVCITGCKSKEAKELIVNKWKFTDISGPDAAKIPDSMKTKMMATATMEFKKDGTYEQAGGMRENIQKGTYSLSNDGKTLYSTENGTTYTDTVTVLELSKDKFVVTPKTKSNGQDMRLTMKPK